MSPAYLRPAAARARYEALRAYEDRGEELTAAAWHGMAARLRAAAEQYDGALRTVLLDRAYDAEMRGRRAARDHDELVATIRSLLGYAGAAA